MRSRLAQSAIALLKDDPFVFCDVGARGGLPKPWDGLASALSVVAFEPDCAEADRLASVLKTVCRDVTVVRQATWAHSGILRLYQTRIAGCSSLFRPDKDRLIDFPEAKRFEVVSEESVEAVTLDSAFATRQIVPDFLKIDAQGGTLPILKGGPNVLDTIVGMHLEIELMPMYADEPLFGEVDTFVRSRGFELIDLRPTFWRRRGAQDVAGAKGQLVFCDALYMLTPEKLGERLDGRSDTVRRRILASAILASTAYHMWDRVVLYVDAAGTMSQEQAFAALSKTARAGSASARMIPEFRGRMRLGLMLQDISDALLRSRSNWGTAEQQLGNIRRS